MRRFQINHAKVSTSRPRGRGTRPPAGAPAAGLPEPRSAADLPATAAARRVQHPKATPEPAERSDSDVLLTATLPGAPSNSPGSNYGAAEPLTRGFCCIFFPRIRGFAAADSQRRRSPTRGFAAADSARRARLTVSGCACNAVVSVSKKIN